MKTIIIILLFSDTINLKLKTIIPKSNKTVYIFKDKKNKLKLVSNSTYNFSDSIKIVK